jgi:hypothetical protein
MADKFWYYDYTILYDKYRLFDFIPVKGNSLEMNMNSIARFFIYLSFILVILNKGNINYFGYALFGLFSTYIIYFTIEQKEGMTSIDSVTRPTKNNPFMNVLLNEYVKNPTRPQAASIDNEQIRADIDKHFNHNLYKDVDDVWSKANSQRQYYTMPNTQIPNDRDAFAKWCFQDPNVCKDGAAQMCGKYEMLNVNSLPGEIKF